MPVCAKVLFASLISIAIVLEVGWEILENSPIIIELDRVAAIDQFSTHKSVPYA